MRTYTVQRVSPPVFLSLWSSPAVSSGRKDSRPRSVPHDMTLIPNADLYNEVTQVGGLSIQINDDAVK